MNHDPLVRGRKTMEEGAGVILDADTSPKGKSSLENDKEMD